MSIIITHQEYADWPISRFAPLPPSPLSRTSPQNLFYVKNGKKVATGNDGNAKNRTTGTQTKKRGSGGNANQGMRVWGQGPSKVLPDFLVRKYDAGVNVTPADQEAWEWFQALFFAPVQPAQKTKAQRLEERAKTRAKGKAKGKGRAGGQ